MSFPQVIRSQVTGACTVSQGLCKAWSPVEYCTSFLSKLFYPIKSKCQYFKNIYLILFKTVHKNCRKQLWFGVSFLVINKPRSFGLYFDCSSKWGIINSRNFLRDRESFMTIYFKSNINRLLVYTKQRDEIKTKTKTPTKFHSNQLLPGCQGD